MIKTYDSPQKRLWRQEVLGFIKKHNPDKGQRRRLSAVCLAGPELLEVEEVYDPAGIHDVVCVEIDKNHYSRMLERREERRREGKPVPEIVNDDVREYLKHIASRGEAKSIIFLDFDGNDHALVQECLEVIAGGGCIFDRDCIVGFAALGLRETPDLQLDLRVQAGACLSDQETADLLVIRVQRDSEVKRLLCHARRKVAVARGEKRSDDELKRGRDMFFSQLLTGTMFRGRGLAELASHMTRDPRITGLLEGCTGLVMGHISASFDLAGVDEGALRCRVMELVAEASAFRTREVHAHLLGGMMIGYQDDFVRSSMLVSQLELLSYMAAKCTRPYFCTDLLSLYYAKSSSSPMYTDIGVFERVNGFENRIVLGTAGSVDGPVVPMPSGNGHLRGADIRKIRRVVRRLGEYEVRYSHLFRKRKELAVKGSGEDNGLPALRTNEEVADVVGQNPLLSVDDIFERYNVVGLSYDSVRGLMMAQLKRMGRKYLSKEERLAVSVLARIELGVPQAEIAKELHVSSVHISLLRGKLFRGEYERHLRQYIDEAMAGIIEERQREAAATKRAQEAQPDKAAQAHSRSDSPSYAVFSGWAKGSIENAEEMLSVTEAELQYLMGVDSELGSAKPGHLHAIVSGFSYFEPYELRPLELFRIADAIRAMQPDARDSDLLGRVAAEAEVQMRSAAGPLSAAYPGFGIDGNGAEKMHVSPKHRSQLLAWFGYHMIMELASGR